MEEEKGRKQQITIATLGYENSGKSTIAGYILHQHNSFSQLEIQLVERGLYFYGRDNSFKFSWLLNKTQHEREALVTVRNNIRSFEDEKRIFTLIDTPGCDYYIRSTIFGVFKADFVLFVTGKEMFQSDNEKNILKDIKKRLLIAFCFGVKKFIISINKLDFVKFSQISYEKATEKFVKICKQIGIKKENFLFIPTNSNSGENIDKIPINEKFQWYHGPTLIDQLKTLKINTREINKPLRIICRQFFKINNRDGNVIIGMIESGKIRKGEEIKIMPLNKLTVVLSIERENKEINEGIAGDIIGIRISPFDIKLNDLRRGMIISHSFDDQIKIISSVIAKILVVDPPTKLIKKGYSPSMNCHALHLGCQFVKFISRINKNNEKEIEEDNRKNNNNNFYNNNNNNYNNNNNLNNFNNNEEINLNNNNIINNNLNDNEIKGLRKGERGIVEIKLLRKVCVEEFSLFPSLGRFLLRENNNIVAIGVILSVIPLNSIGSLTKPARK